MKKQHLIQHPYVSFHNRVVKAYNKLNEICFEGRLPPADNVIHWSRKPHMPFLGCMFGVHGVIVGIVLSADITSMQVLIEVLMHEMAHADVEVKQLPIGRSCHGKHFKESATKAVAVLEANRSVLEALVDTQLNVDVDQVRRAKRRRRFSPYRK